jgi:hypothetical protein
MAQKLGTCDACGDENPYSNIVCTGCGARLPWADTLSPPSPKKASCIPQSAIVTNAAINTSAQTTTTSGGAANSSTSTKPLIGPNGEIGFKGTLATLGVIGILFGMLYGVVFVCVTAIEKISDAMSPATESIAKQVGIQRDLSTPSKRLAGHWTDGAGNHWYYGNAEQGQTGSYAVSFNNGIRSVHKGYQAVSETPSGEFVLVKLFFADGDSWQEKYFISKDGKRMVVELTTRMTFDPSLSHTSQSTRTYVGSETQP